MLAFRPKFTYANVVATIALVIALGTGTASAARALILGSSIKPGTVSGKQLARNAVTSINVANGSLLAADFKRGQLKAGPQGAPGTQGPPGTTGAPGRSALTPLQSGETIRGAWATRGATATGSNSDWDGVTFPIPPSVPVDSAHVVVAGNDSVVGDGCTGSYNTPVSAPGFVCIYFGTVAATTSALGYSASGSLIGSPTATGDGTVAGFVVAIVGNDGFRAAGTWSYTAP